MPAKSKQQFKYIQAMKSKYGSKKNAPKNKKWVFDKEWTSGVSYKDLPKRKNEIYRFEKFNEGIFNSQDNSEDNRIAKQILNKIDKIDSEEIKRISYSDGSEIKFKKMGGLLNRMGEMYKFLFTLSGYTVIIEEDLDFLNPVTQYILKIDERELQCSYLLKRKIFKCIKKEYFEENNAKANMELSQIDDI